MPYKVNGTEITIQPTTGRWLQRYTLGRTGAGNAIYPQIREFEMRWQLGNQAHVRQLVNFFGSMSRALVASNVTNLAAGALSTDSIKSIAPLIAVLPR